MEIRLLGPVGLWHASREVALARSHRRCVLAVLAMAAGQPVSMDTLIDRVWGDQPPRSPVHSLYTHVSALRRKLAQLSDPGSGARLLRRGGGYLLEVDRDRVDLHRARQCAEEARRLTDGGPDHAWSATKLLREACALWRGPALAGLPGDWAERARTGLEQERLSLLVARYRMELQVGEHPAAVDQLAELLADHPMVEPLAGLYMLALYRCGRQADALAVYGRTRQRMIDELGAEPGPELRQVHRIILDGDPVTHPGGPTVPVAPTAQAEVVENPMPAQLPPDVATFSGRSHELRGLDALLPEQATDSTATPIAAVSGAPGVGKTALAVRWAHRVRHRFPGGQLYADLRGFASGAPLSPGQVLARFLTALGVPRDQVPTEVDEAVAVYRSTLADRRVLVVLDNAAGPDQVRPLLPSGPGSCALVTSRHRLGGLVAREGAHSRTLDLLSHDEARALLASRLGDQRAASESGALDLIIERCARLPLALAVAAARAAAEPHLPLQMLVDQLADVSSRLDTLDSGDATSDVRTVLSWSYQSLTPAAARAFRLLGLHAGPDISLPAAASLTGQPVPHVRRLLAELSRAHLVNEHTPGRYALHDLLHAYAAELAHDPQPDATALERLLDHYIHTACAAGQFLDPHRQPIPLCPPAPGTSPEQLTDHPQAMAWFTAERPAVLAMVDHAAAARLDSRVWLLARVLVQFLDWGGDWHDLAATQDAALRSAQRQADLAQQGYSHLRLSQAQGRLGRYDDARGHAHAGLQLYQAIEDRAGQAEAHQTLAWLCGRQEQYRESLHHLQQALGLCRAAGDRRGEALALNNLGMAHFRLGNPRQAIAKCEEALAMQQETGDPIAAYTWDSLGQAHHRLGEHQQAASCYQHAIDLCGNGRLGGDEADFRIRLGEAHHAAGDPDGARRAWRSALAILDERDPSHAEAVRAKLAPLASRHARDRAREGIVD